MPSGRYDAVSDVCRSQYLSAKFLRRGGGTNSFLLFTEYDENAFKRREEESERAIGDVNNDMKREPCATVNIAKCKKKIMERRKKKVY